MKIDLRNIEKFASKEEYNSLFEEAKNCDLLLKKGTGKGSEYLGWVSLPNKISREEILEIKATATRLRSKCNLIVIIGIGGSYLGTKAVVEALSKPLSNINNGPKKDPIIVYAGHQMSSDYLFELQEILDQYEIGVVVISKSGTTTEPAIAFRLLKDYMDQRYGRSSAAERIVAITDQKKGALRELSNIEKYETYTIDDNIGGRFSVLSPVGLLPIAIAGFDIQLLLDGAANMKNECDSDPNNIAIQYAAARNMLYKNGKKIEILASFSPEFQYFAEWWKQLYGESEGKEGKGIFPASAIFSTDLHSMGQYIQQGERIIFETFLSVSKPKNNITIKSNVLDLDKLNFIAGKSLSEVNETAQQGTILAHEEGGVPCMVITIDRLNEVNIGAMIYMFERACGISGYMLNVNPFDQPGVEAYKDNMYALLGKPGYEQQQKILLKKLK